MTQEEKELVLRDLSARWPHGVNVQIRSFSLNLSEPVILDLPIKGVINFASTDCVLTVTENGDIVYDPISNCKPYLRPMSSMTEEEKEQFKKHVGGDNTSWYLLNEKCIAHSKSYYSVQCSFSLISKVMDWLNAHHFDYRGLIPMGLALEAPEDMYNI